MKSQNLATHLVHAVAHLIRVVLENELHRRVRAEILQRNAT